MAADPRTSAVMLLTSFFGDIPGSATGGSNQQAFERHQISVDILIP